MRNQQGACSARKKTVKRKRVRRHIRALGKIMGLKIRAGAALVAAGVTMVAASAAAQDADYYRGGWRNEAGAPQIYELAKQ